MNFSENLQKLRKEKNISQEKLAEELKVSRQTVGKWENGVSCPEAECLIEISDFFGVSIDTLLKGTVAERNEMDKDFSEHTDSQLGDPGANSAVGFFMVLCIAIGIGLLLYNRLSKDQAE